MNTSKLNLKTEGSGILDLGQISDPLLIFGGPYSNLQATLAIKSEADRLGIQPDRCLCTGDVVAYCADPQETVHLIRKWNPWVVMGNCEQALSFGKKDCGCGFDEGSACDTLSKQWFSYVDAKLGADNRQWMKTLPQTICFEMAGKRIVAIHGGVDDISRFIFSSTPMDIKVKQAHLAQADVIIAGHCGLPFTQILDNGVIWHNAGVIGMPANDGTPDGWYALLTPNAGKITITHHRLSYEHTTAALRMRSRSLAEGYARALENGRWPSLDVLPPQERENSGQRLVIT